MAVSAKTEYDVQAPLPVVMELLMDVESLPDWSGPHKSAEILDEYDDGAPKRVKIAVSMGPITDEQVIEYTWTENSCTWDLVEATQLSQQHGEYHLSEGPNGTTHVEFELSVDLKVKLPGLLLRQAQKVAVETSKKGVSAEAKRRAAQ
ncbi:cyclase [Gordonia sp. TBRC 11910]|uniref:Cyclase n=1 Tax=Gordonia asplenii TaxID=2725283 RepID=A0A848KRZ2_9ACTN|nr:SRPBCC family protein [Gordonia asplenii]NMO00727.1 cyclase [Gordonia asplenii]